LNGSTQASDHVALIGWSKGEAVDLLNTFITATKLEAVKEFETRFMIVPALVLSEETALPPVKRGKKTATTSAAPSSPLVVETVTSDTVAEEKTETPAVILSPEVSPATETVAAPVPAVPNPVEPPESREQEAPTTTEIYVKGQPTHAAAARDAFTEALVSLEGEGAQSWAANPKYKAAAGKCVTFLLENKVVVLVNGNTNPELASILLPVVKAAIA
jgi:hypothetical protein